ncbi:MAG: CHASE2 domain-containing protein [Candidatus Protistobacter heckmanni]|nr:CHASE2 domain-containing protein [Candidatus Protistobacter heckmanni]
MLVKALLFVKKPSPDVVIVDIDEGSLKDMAKQYSRCPWPNQIFADLLTGLDRQNPKAVVFDILFSDRDTLRPESDAAFNAAVAKSSTAFFPMVRLSAENDAKSRIKTAWLPGARRLDDPPTADSGISLILPQVPAALESGRMGFLNVYQDKDGILRRYPLRLDNDGLRFDSYALKVACTAGAKPREDAADFLIKWRGCPFTYRFLSFKDLYHGLRGDPGAKPPLELKDKIVIVGSTAPALFDIKATPVARLHPGVEILATAIDNLSAGDAIHTLPNIVPPLLGILFMWVVGYGFFRNVPDSKINLLFTASQGGFIATSFICLSFFDLYVDLSAAITYGLIYFSAARLYAKWRRDHLASLSLLQEKKGEAFSGEILSIMHSPGDKKAADMTEFIFLRWLEISPPNSRVYLPWGLEKNSIDDLVCGNFIVNIFGAKTGDSHFPEIAALQNKIANKFADAGLSPPRCAFRSISLEAGANIDPLDYVRAQIFINQTQTESSS